MSAPVAPHVISWSSDRSCVLDEVIAMGIKAHPRKPGPTQPAIETNPPTIAPYAMCASRVAIGVP